MTLRVWNDLVRCSEQFGHHTAVSDHIEIPNDHIEVPDAKYFNPTKRARAPKSDFSGIYRAYRLEGMDGISTF